MLDDWVQRFLDLFDTDDFPEQEIDELKEKIKTLLLEFDWDWNPRC